MRGVPGLLDSGGEGSCWLDGWTGSGDGARARIGTYLLCRATELKRKCLVLDLRLGISGGMVRVLDLGVRGRGRMRLMTGFVAAEMLVLPVMGVSPDLLAC